MRACALASAVVGLYVCACVCVRVCMCVWCVCVGRVPVFLCALELWVTEDGGVSLEWRVLVGICVCTFWAAFVELCVGGSCWWGPVRGGCRV